ncbi:MAG: hypothetical protein ACUVXI_14705 [bacterium]
MVGAAALEERALRLSIGVGVEEAARARESDVDLVRQTLRGDSGAFSALVERHKTPHLQPDISHGWHQGGGR